MAPATTAPHRSGNHERYLPAKSSDAARFQAELDGDNSDAEPNALQPVQTPQASEWEGLDGQEDEGTGENENEAGDAESVDVQLEAKKTETPVLPKDAEEAELERMIFGDSAGFKQGLEAFSLDPNAGAYGDSSEASGAEQADLDEVADQDLFFFDAGPIAAPAGSVAAGAPADTDGEDDKPAWEDSDDERLVVSLASVPQLRKLRETEEDDMVNGKEYARRLRKQFERLYPAPQWATHATGKTNMKRRRTMDEDASGADSASDMEVDDDDLSTQPLAKLLKDADILSQASRRSTKRRKLQAGTVDIQRLKDVSKAGPVRTTLPFNAKLTLTPLLVCHYLVVISSVLPTAPLLRPQLDPLPSPRQPQSTHSKSAPYISAYKTHATCHHRVSPVGVRLTHFP